MLYIIFAVLISNCVKSKAELFSSIAGMEVLLKTEERTIDDIDLYIHKQEQRLSNLKRYMQVLKKEHNKVMEDIPNYLGNPINAFRMIKRLSIDLSNLIDNIREDCILDKIVSQNNVLYRDVEDLTGAALAVARIQNVYKLDAEDIAQGILPGVAHSSSMTASDCFELGRILYDEKDHKNARDWMIEAFRKYREENLSHSFTDNDILNYINSTCHGPEESKIYQKWSAKILSIVPEHPRIKEILTYCQRPDRFKRRLTSKTAADLDLEKFEALCRGELDVPLDISSRLTCRYLSENHAFLTVAPFKIEMLYLKPDVMLFHNVLSDNEMETIKKMAKSQLKRSKIIDPDTGKSTVLQFRISKSAVLEDSDSETVARISKRVKHMTGLNIDTAEIFAVINYGIGGFYAPHWDFFQKDIVTRRKIPNGDRIATVLFYTSDVAAGGATVFSRLGVSVAPIKGTAVFFYNLLPVGKEDYSTRHGGCPVIQGSKWVVSRWLHEGGQELLKPCRSNPRKDDFIRNVAKPVAKLTKQKLELELPSN